jgi:chorismate synthase
MGAALAEPAVASGVVESVLSTALGSNPGVPVQSPLSWMVVAAARRQIGQENPAAVSAAAMSTGEVLRVRAAMKPISTIPRALRTVDVSTGEEAPAINQRSDVCAVPAAGVVAEAMVILTLAEAVLEKFGGDTVAETARNLRGYLDSMTIR